MWLYKWWGKCSLYIFVSDYSSTLTFLLLENLISEFLQNIKISKGISPINYIIMNNTFTKMFYFQFKNEAMSYVN